MLAQVLRVLRRDPAVYLDHAASSPLLPQAYEAVREAAALCGGAGAAHASGRRVAAVVEQARASVGAALGALPGEVVFTGGGTEGDNLAVKGLWWAQRARDPRRTRVLVSPAEHPAVLGAVRWLADSAGAQVTWLPVDDLGRVAVGAVRQALDDDVALITMMLANNEVGTVQPLDEIVALGHAAGAVVHTDAVQVVGQLPLDFSRSGVDACTVSGHKFGGPLGVGALLLREDVPCTPLLHGLPGDDDTDVAQGGHLSVAALAGLGVAVGSAVHGQPAEAARLCALRDDLVRRVLEAVPDARLNGDPVGRLPGNANISFAGCQGDSLLLLLDARGVEVSTGSACSAGVPQPSHVLRALGLDDDAARGSLRFSLGHTSSASDVDALVEVLPAVVERARGMRR